MVPVGINQNRLNVGVPDIPDNPEVLRRGESLRVVSRKLLGWRRTTSVKQRSNFR
jgi:hypothetical protein